MSVTALVYLTANLFIKQKYLIFDLICMNHEEEVQEICFINKSIHIHFLYLHFPPHPNPLNY